MTLQKSADDNWKAVQTGAALRRQTSRRTRSCIKGRVSTPPAPTPSAPAQATVRYGIENFFVPEGTGRDLEKLVGEKKLAALIAVDDDGNAGIKGLIVEGKRVYEEPLL